VTAHEGHAVSSGAPLLLVAVLLAAGYVGLAVRQRGGWSGWRTAFFVSGTGLLAVAALPVPVGGFPGHMFRHLLIGMLAPTGLALGAPVTLLLRSVPPRWGRVLGRALRHPVTRVATHPATVLLLNLGGLVALHTTPLYAVTTHHETAHHLVHVHFLVTGYLFAWLVAGPDPAPHRPGVPARLVLLGIAIAVHASLAQLMYAGIGVTLPVPVAERRIGAELMYYGGDIAELLLAVALLSTWRPRRRGSAPGSPEIESRGRNMASRPGYALRHHEPT
jgi:putative membrane protein